jgi:hypothetical protein
MYLRRDNVSCYQLYNIVEQSGNKNDGRSLRCDLEKPRRNARSLHSDGDPSVFSNSRDNRDIEASCNVMAHAQTIYFVLR